MRKTFENFKNLATLFEGQTSNLDALTQTYQQTEDPALLAVVFCELYPYTLTQVENYFYLTDEDKASIAVEELHKSMMHFDPTKGAKIQTLFSRYLNRRLYAETSMLNHQKRKANNDCDDFEAFAEIKQGYEERAYENVEFITQLEKADQLSDNELKYCNIVMREHIEITDSEIARELGMSPSAIYQMKQRLAKKFTSLQAV